MTKVVNAVRKVEKKFVGELKKSSVGRSLARVIEPLLDGKAKVDDEIGRFGRSKFGKVVITAVAIYFGGAALAGAMGGGAAAATGASGWAGAAQGLSGAWTGVAQAGSALAAGEFGAAGSALSTGAAGGSAAGAAGTTGVASAAPSAMNTATNLAADSFATGAATGGAAAGGAAGTAASAAPGAITGGSSMVAPSYAAVTQPVATVGAGAAPAASSSSGMLSGFFSNPRNTPALLQAGSGMLGSLAQSNQQKAMYQMENEKQEDMRRRYGANIGTRLWGS